MVYLTAGGEAVLRTLTAANAIQNLPVAPRPPLPTAPLARIPLPAVGGGAAAGGGVAGGAATASSAAATAGAIGAGVVAFGVGFAFGDAIAGSLGIEYPGGKNALQYFFGGKNPGIGATGAIDAPLATNYEGDPPFTGGQSSGVLYRISYSVGGSTTEGVLPSILTYGPISGLTRQESPGPGPFGEPYAVSYPGMARDANGNPVQIFLNLGGTTGRWISPFPGEAPYLVTGLNITRADGEPDTGGNPRGNPEPGTLPRRAGAPLTATPTAPAASPTPTIAPKKPSAPATPGEPVNPPKERDPLLPKWLDPLTAVGVAVGAAAGLAGSPSAGPDTTPINNPTPSDDGSSNSPPRKTRTDEKCRCNIPLMNKLDDLQKNLDRSVGAANIAGDGGIFAYLVKMQTFAEKAWEATRLQKVVNALTLLTVVHNASMISRDVGETLGYAIAQGLDVLGVEDEKGQTLDVNNWFGKQTTAFFEGIFGVERWRGLNATWNKANRIISSASNIVYTIRSISDGVKEVTEMAAENTGKIGNALKRSGLVTERSYPWMAEKVRAQDAWSRKTARVMDGLESAENIAGSFAQVTSNVKEIQEETAELKEQTTAFQALVGAPPETTKVATPEENAAIVTAGDEGATNAKAGPAVTATDMEPGTNGTT